VRVKEGRIAAQQAAGKNELGMMGFSSDWPAGDLPWPF